MLSSVLRHSAGLTLVLLLASTSQSQLTPEKAAELDSVLKAALAAGKIPGMSAAVSLAGKVVWTGAAGFSDLENSVTAKPQTVYRLASVSKPITAVLALQLWEQGKLDLDAPVQRYVPKFPAKKWTVTCRQLLSHQGGVRHYKSDAEVETTRRYTDVGTALDIFKDDPLLHEPGTKYLYSSYGYNLLGATAEAAGGKRFVDLLEEGVFRPACTATLRPDDAWEIIPDRAQGYRFTAAGKLVNSVLADVSNKIPGGGLCGTAEDLVRFGAALMEGKLLKPATLEMMWTPQPTKDGKLTDYGLGWRIGSTGGVKWVSHGGAQPRVTTYLLVIPDRKLAVAVMCNLEEFRAITDVCRKLAGVAGPVAQ